jgi:hypothetical protein
MADGEMTFTVTHKNNPLGGQTLTIEAKSKARLTHVTTVLDDITVDDADLNPPGTSYRTTRNQAGDFRPGADHHVVVRATDENGFSDAHHERWTD